MARTYYVVIATALLAAAVAGPSGFLAGRRLADRQRGELARASGEVERLILAYVVERNPQATIRDFSEFPRALLEASEAAGLDYRLILAICSKESDMNPRAISPRGAVGLCQVMPETASAIARAAVVKGVDPYRAPSRRGPDGRYADLGSLGDPSANVRLTILYFKDQVARFGVSARALRAYNRGPREATEHRPHDRYAEDVALINLSLVSRLPR